MLTPKQAESAVSALAMRPETHRRDMLTCPACNIACISATTRRRLGFVGRTSCSNCGALLRLKGGRTVFAIYVLILSITGVAVYLAWPADRRLVQTFVGPFIAVMYIVMAATLRGLPLVAE